MHHCKYVKYDPAVNLPIGKHNEEYFDTEASDIAPGPIWLSEQIKLALEN